MMERMKRVRLKWILRMGFCLALIAAMVLIGAAMVGAEEPEYSEGLRFSYYVNGTCAVSGVGSCKDTDIVIPPTSPRGDVVVGIYPEAFKGNTKITSVVFPEGLIHIDNQAFRNCTSLTTVTISESVKYINQSAFEGCSNLTNVIVQGDSNLTTIGHSAFSECTNLVSFSIPSNATLTTISGYAFENCKNLKTITIPASVKEIDAYAFYNCYSMENVAIPENSELSTIGSYAFNGCSSLKSVFIPAGVKTIQKYAFYYCYGMESVAISEGVETIGEYAFRYCRGLTSITIPASVTEIADYAFGYCEKLENIIIPDNSRLVSIGSGSFADCSNLTSVTLPESLQNLSSGSFARCTKLIQQENGVSYVGKWVIDCDDSVKTVQVRDDTVGISSSAFYRCGLEIINIPKGVKSIGDRTFYGCTNLTQVTIPQCSQLTRIGEEVFYDCSALTQFDDLINTNLSSIGYRAFYGCNSLESIQLPDSVESIGESAFGSCKKLADVTLPNNLVSIGDSAFSNCTNLTSIHIPEKVMSIGIDAFPYRTMTSVTIDTDNTAFSIINGCLIDLNTKTLIVALNNACEIPSDGSIEIIGNRAFMYNSSLTNLVIPNSIKEIGAYAFANCDNLKFISVPNSVTKIGTGAFSSEYIEEIYYNSNVGHYSYFGSAGKKGSGIHLIIGKDITKIPSTFVGWEYTVKDGPKPTVPYVRTVVFEAGTECTEIGNYAFGDSYVREIELPDSLRVIGTGAFCHSGLRKISIPENVVDIGDDAFGGCYSLEELYYNAINVGEFDTSLTWASNAFQGAGLNTTGLKVVIGNKVKKIPAGLFHTDDPLYSRPPKILSIEFEGNSSWISIDYRAFYKAHVEIISIPITVTTIETAAFEKCNGLTDVYYYGTESDWNAIVIGDKNEPLLNATIHFLGEPTESKLTSASLTLGQSLALNYYATLTPAHTAAQMRFTYHGETITVDGILDETTGEYKFTLGRIPPQCMGDTVKAELILVAEDGTETVLDVKESYSIRRYCDDALTANPENETLTTLLADLLAYGDAAQDYANYNEDTPVSEGFTVTPSEWQEVTDTDFTLSDKTREELCFTAAGVRFGYVNRLYFKLKAADLTGVTVTVNGKTYTAEDLTLVEDTADTYILYTDAVYATEFDKIFTAELTVDGEVIQTVTYSVKSYVFAKQNGNDDMAALAKALYNYGRSALAYKNAQ